MDPIEQEKSLKDYLDSFRRRKVLFIFSALTILVIGTLTALLLPATYRSSATILIEQQEIPDDLVRSTITTYADQRIQMISQRVMTRTNLSRIIEQYDLYTEERERYPLEVIIAGMMEDLDLSMISADVIDPRSGRPMEATIAFRLSYKNQSPKLAQVVTNEMTSLFLRENIKTRTSMATQTSEFLAKESESLSAQIVSLEAQLAEFKNQHLLSLPELTSLNLQLLNRTESEILGVDQELRALAETQIYLESELAQIEPYNAPLYSENGERLLSPADRLKVLETQYLSLAALYSDTHPDVIRAKREKEALSQELGAQNKLSDTALFEEKIVGLETQLEAAEAELKHKSERYAPEHPDIRALTASIIALRDAIESTSIEQTTALVQQQSNQSRVDSKNADNPAYVQIKTRLEATLADINALKKRRTDLLDRLTDLESRITSSPTVEKQYRVLTRDYETAVGKYQETKIKLAEAKMAESLETGKKGERFTLIEPPLVPEEPISPNRPMILVLSLVLALVGGGGLIMLLDNLDDRINSPTEVETLTDIPVLAAIPYIHTEQHILDRQRMLKITLAAGVGILVSAMISMHLFVKPLDVALAILMRRLGI